MTSERCRGGISHSLLILGLTLLVGAVLAGVASFAATGILADDADDSRPALSSSLPPPKYPNLDSTLSRLVAGYEQGGLPQISAAAGSPVHSGESVAVILQVDGNSADVRRRLAEIGGDPRNVGDDYVEAYVPVSRLGAASQLPGVYRVQVIVPPQADYGTSVSQGAAVHGAPAWHTAGYTGAGVKVGVIDAGFDGFKTLQQDNAELPTEVVARCYSRVGEHGSDIDDCGRSVHGTAVAETIMDMAPGVELYISNPRTEGDLKETVDWMVAQDVDVINMSLGYLFNGPGDGSSPYSNSVLRSVDAAVAGGIFWANAAGNGANGGNWFGSYLDTDNDRWLEFSPGDESSALTLYSRVILQLRWEDTWGGATSDLELYIVRGSHVSSTNGSQDGGDKDVPYEMLAFYPSSNYGVYNLFVRHDSGPVPDWVQLVVWGNRLEHYTAEYSISNPAESSNLGMLAVGAAPYSSPTSIEPYSSQGPTPDGRTKPDIVGADCGQVASLREAEHPVGQRCWFPGTSQSSPHVAGMAALVKQAYPNFTPAQIATYLKDTAEQREITDSNNNPLDPNNVWGHGFVRLPTPPSFGDNCSADLGRISAPDSEPKAEAGSWSNHCDSANRAGSYAKFYNFALDESAQVTIDLESTEDAYLFLLDGSGNTVLASNDNRESGDTDSRVTETLPAGSYIVEATTYASARTGPFTLTLTGGAGQPPLSVCLTDLGGISGSKTETGTWSSGCDSANRPGSYAKFFTFTVDQTTEVTIDLESTEDPYLFLLNGSGRDGTVLASNDDRASGDTNSRIAETLAAGSYTVEATTYRGSTTGDFTLTLTVAEEQPPSSDCSVPLGSISGSKTETGAWSSSCDSVNRVGSYAKFFTFTLDSSTEVTIDLESTEDPYLFLLNGSGREGTVLASNDDRASGDTNSRIAETLAAGSYTIEATTYRGATTGDFTLTLTVAEEQLPSSDCSVPLGSISGSKTETGTWSSSCDSVNRSISYAKFFTFTLDSSTEVTIDLESSEDPYLFLLNGSGSEGTVLASNDDRASGDTNSRIAETLSAGSYTIEATTYRGATTGAFTLTVAK